MSRSLSLLITCLVASLVFAEDGPQEAKPKVTETVVVTATRSERAVSELPVSTTVVSEEEIETAPATVIDDLLRTIPGIQMPLLASTAALPAQQYISMHGLGGNRALVLVDGVPIHDGYDGSVLWQEVSLTGVRQIEVVRGGNSSLYGNFALGGTVNMITRPVDANGVRLDASYGSHETHRASVAVDHRINDKLGVRVLHDRFETDGFIRVPKPGPVDVAGWSGMTLTGARVDFDSTAGTTGYLKANLLDTDMSFGTALYRNRREIFNVAAGGQHIIGDRNLLSATLYHRSIDENAVSAAIVGARESEFRAEESQIPTGSTGASLEWSSQRSGAIRFVSLGADFQQLVVDEDRLSYNPAGDLTRQTLVHGRQRFAGLFGQVSWQPSERLEILGSGRVEYFRNYEGEEVVIGGAATSYPSASYTEFNPRVSFRYALGSRSAVRGSAYRAFHAPSLRFLYRTQPLTTGVFLSNPYLEPETLKGAEVGMEWSLSRAHIELNVYRSDMDGFQAGAGVPGQPPTVIQFQNLGSIRAQGIEAMAGVRLSPRWTIDAAYTYADSTVTEALNPAFVGKFVPAVPPHLGSLSVRYAGAAGTTAGLRARVVSRSYGEPMNRVVAPAHRVIDFSLSHPLRQWLDVFGTIENALDERYYYVIGTTNVRNAAPRTVNLGFRARLGGGNG